MKNKVKFSTMIILLITFMQLQVFETFCFLQIKSSNTIYVPDDFSKIQEAINHANPGDTIIVRAGTYLENIVVNVSGITLKSDIGAEKTIIDGNKTGDVIKITADNVTVEGFTITGSGTGDAGLNILHPGNTVNGNNIKNNGIGIWINSSNNTICRNNIKNNFFYGIFCSRSSNAIYANNIKNNGYGIELLSSWNNVSFNVFVGDGLHVVDSFSNDVVGNLVNSKPLVYLEDVSDVEISDAGQVIAVNSEKITIRDLNISNTDIAIELWNVNQSIIENCTLQNNKYGIDFWYSSDNTICGSNITSSLFGIYLWYSSNNIIYGNNIKNNYDDGINIFNSSGNIIFGNDVENNGVYGISLTYGNGNVFYLNNFKDNAQNVYLKDSKNIWNSPGRLEYVYGDLNFTNHMGNYWSDYAGQDNNGDGIGDIPFTLDSENVDNYPIIEPTENYMYSCVVVKGSNLVFSQIFGVYSSALGIVEVRQMPPISKVGFPMDFAVPADTEVLLKFSGSLKSKDDPLWDKEVDLFINDVFIASNVTGQDGKFTIYAAISLPYGMHEGVLMFKGDEEYGSAYSQFTILSYNSIGFNITKDAYHFQNWNPSKEEYEKYVLDKVENKVFRSALRIARSIFEGEMCFGMAATSSLYYIGKLEKPELCDTYALGKDSALYNIAIYQLSQLITLERYRQLIFSQDMSSAFERIKELVDESIPPLFGYEFSDEGNKKLRHYVTIMGYFEDGDESFLIAYDSNYPNRTYIIGVNLTGNYMTLVGGNKISKVEVVDPRNIPLVSLENLAESIYESFIGLAFLSPVDVYITSSEGEVLRIVNNTIIENSIVGSYVSEYNLFLLPSNKTYSVRAVGIGIGNVTIDYVYLADGQVVVDRYSDVEVQSGSVLELEIGVKPQPTLYVDFDGDGKVDQTIKPQRVGEEKPPRGEAPGIPLMYVIVVVAMCFVAIVVYVAKRRVKNINYPFFINETCYQTS